jgi:putative DNA methylase
MTDRKKLIEVALPLEAINRESAREKSIRHGHPSTLHLWWARRPLAACRAVLFSSIVDDPDQEGVPEALLKRIDELPLPDNRGENWARLSLGEQRRERLFAFIEKLVKWENSTDEKILTTARELILAATDGNPPPVLDPFCGGGSIPLEAQRLGLEAHASDLNPVAVLITKALIEIPPKFANQPPVNPEDRARGMGTRWKGAAGLAADVRYYGKWMRDEAEKRIGHLYPKVKLPPEQGGGEATVIAWLWARTVKCPNPGCGAQMPLVRSFWLSTKKGHETWVEPVVNQADKTVRFEVKTGPVSKSLKAVIDRGTGFQEDGGKKVKATFRCVCCTSGIARGNYIDDEANAGHMKAMSLAIVAEGQNRRIYVPFDHLQVRAPNEAEDLVATPALRVRLPSEPCRGTFASNAQGRVYGFKTFADYFTARQLVALVTFSELVTEAREQVQQDTVSAGSRDDDIPLYGGVTGAAYADAVATYLGMGVSRMSDICNSLCQWENSKTQVRHIFTRQAIPMLWDFAEPNIFSETAGDFGVSLGNLVRALETTPSRGCGKASQQDAKNDASEEKSILVSTDPPYYDNIGYADLSDFFYVWLRRSVGQVYPDLFSTLLTPKSPELIASSYRFGGNAGAARTFFEDGLSGVFQRLRRIQASDLPLTVYYAFKQSEADDDAGESSLVVASTGWETMLEALLNAEFQITGTWPMRSELGNRMLASGTNALASSIVLVCRPRPADARVITRRELLASLKKELPDALRNLQKGNVAPVDLAQAAIGPGMAVFSRYSQVVESDGSPMRVRTALQLINQALDEVLAEQESEYDAETRWAVAWFEQYGAGEGPYGVAETLSKAKDCSVERMAEAGLVQARAGKVRLLRRDELSDGWDAATARRVTVWEVTQRLARALNQGGDTGAAELVAKLPDLAEVARDLAYRLYVTSDRKGWTQEALAYNGLVVAWPEISSLAAKADRTPRQSALPE